MADQQKRQQEGEQRQEQQATADQNRFNVNVIANLVVPKSKSAWMAIIVLLIFLLFAWYKNFLGFRTILLTFGVTVSGLTAVIIIIGFIIYGWATCKDDLAKFYIATALFIWILDLVPQNFFLIGPWLGPEWAGFIFPLEGIWKISWASIFLSGFFFSLLYINMVFNIIEKDYLAFSLGFIFILITNYFLNFLAKYFTFLSYSFNVYLPHPYTILYNIGVIVLLVGFGLGAWYLDKKHRGTAVPEFFSSLYMIFVFSFFWINNGWQGNIRAWFHLIFILAFGFSYIKSQERNNPQMWKILIPSLLIIDFFGYGFLWSSDILILKFIPPIVLFVIVYCYEKETIRGRRNYTYPVAAFVLLVTFFLIMSLKVAGVEEGTIPFVAKKGTTFNELYTQFTDRLKDIIEGRIDIATAGLYRANVEKNRYESLGVYFANLRAADPKFYDKEPITLWGSIRSKTYRDAVIINFSCYRWKDNKKIMADKIIPDIKFPIFTLEEVDTECTFLPSKDKPVPAGSNVITFSAEYNFGTDAYIKAYFMDRDRFREYARENVDPLTEFGIKDKNPAAVFTNGPVEIGLSAGQQPITVSEGYAVKPSIGITLTNRQEIQDKNKKIITRWEGKIKNITELILLTPPGIELKDIESCNSDIPEEKIKCPCTKPFYEYDANKCGNTCTLQVSNPCKEACFSSYSDENKRNLCNKECDDVANNCIKECDRLFQVDEGEGSIAGIYKGYALDVGSLEFRDLNKDIDKHRSFLCRFDPSTSVLDNTPITTRYFRVRARYNYLLENSVTVNVETPPIKEEITLPDYIPSIDFDPSLYKDRVPPFEAYPGFPSSTDLDNYFKNKNSPLVGIGQCIKDVEAETKVPTLVILSVANLESDKSSGNWNKLSGLATLSYALFGIKCTTDYINNNCKFQDKKQCCRGYPKGALDIIYEPTAANVYRSYPNYCESIKDFANLISHTARYKIALDFINNPENMVRAIGQAGYASDPNWADKVIARMQIIKKDIEKTLTVVASSGQQTTQKPLPPTNAKAVDTPNARNSITISWTASPTPNVRYLVYRYKEQSSESLTSYDSAETKYADTNAEDGVNYYYKITAYNDLVESDSIQTNLVKSIDDTSIFPPVGGTT